jgi:hypothetical protein
VLESVIGALTTNRIKARFDLQLSPIQVSLNHIDDIPPLTTQLRTSFGATILVDVTMCSILLMDSILENDPASARVQHLLKLNRYGRRFLVREELWPQCHNPAMKTKILAMNSGDGKRAVIFHFLRNQPEVRPRGEARGRRAGERRSRWKLPRRT